LKILEIPTLDGEKEKKTYPFNWNIRKSTLVDFAPTSSRGL
jgi:hypothetical protein